MKITRKQILEVCSKVNSKVRDVNSGGCGVFAFIMGTYLQQFENCKVRVKVRGYDNKKHLNSLVPKNNNSCSDWNENGIYFNHITLKVKMRGKKAFLIDSNGIYKDDYLYAGSLPVEYLEPIVKNSRGWNDYFNRESIPKILDLIADSFIELPNLIDLSDWEGVGFAKSELPPSMPKSAVTKIKTYLDKRATGGMIIINLQDGYRFPDGDNLAYASSVKDAIAIMRKAA